MSHFILACLLAVVFGAIIGLIVGSIARLLMPGKQPMPLWRTAVYGFIGAEVGNALASLIGVSHTSGIDWIRYVLQIAVAMLLVGVAAPMRAKRRAAAEVA